MKKKKKGGIFAIIAAAVVIIAAAVGIFMSFNRGASEGSGNMVSQGFAAVKGNDLYHVDFSDYKLHRTNLKTGESELLSDDYAVYITNYKNNIYYLGYKPSENEESYVYEYKKYVDGVNDKVIFSDEISSPQLTGGYIYYLKSVPEFHSGYSSRLYRASLNGGSESELVCDALMVSYYVDGNDLYYCDVESTSLVKVSLDAALKTAKETPLAEGEKRSAEELGAQALSQAVVTCMARSGNTLYFVDAQTGNYSLCTYDLKSGEIGQVNNGVPAAVINIYGKFMYYYNTTDFCVYRMNLDGSDVTKITDAGYGYMVLSGDRFITMAFTDDYKQYIDVCDLDGNVLIQVGLNSEEEEYYDESAEGLTDEGAEEEITKEPEEAGETAEDGE